MEGDVAARPDVVEPPHMQSDASQVQVEFVVVPEGIQVQQSFPFREPIAALRSAIAQRMRLPADQLVLQLQGNDLTDGSTLDKYLSKGVDRVTIQVRIEYRAAAAQAPVAPRADFVDVRHDPGDGTKPYTIRVAIERAPPDARPFLGGFAHRLTGQVFHNASCQTARIVNPTGRGAPPDDCRHRETQTVKVISRSIQAQRECGTQMERPGLVLDTSGDREVVPRPYFTSEALTALQIEKVVLLQCFVRYRFARRRALALLRLRMELTNQTKEAAERLQAVQDAQRDMEVRRRLHPTTSSDFGTLVSELQSWCQHETDRIKRNTGDDPTKQATLLRELLDKEVKLLQTIDRLRSSAAVVMKRNGQRERLQRMAAPRPWKTGTGLTVMIQDPWSFRAQELLELYVALRLHAVNVDARLDILLNVKWAVKQFAGALTDEIVALIDREADMLNRGRPVASLAGLRHRLALLFYRFACTPEFNPQAGRV
ncbi:Uncharacterized protein PBTT_00810 [Plasmodiophora brassicae]